MKSDSSRITFDARKHFSSVRMQQGRVQIDADSNEQIDIANHRAMMETGDVVGPCGAPMHYPAFHCVGSLEQLTTEEKALPQNMTLPSGFKIPDFLISAGRYYVDGILCENEKLTAYLQQPDLPDATAPSEAGTYLVYVDVWQRLVTALDDPSIREIALAGPDTTTRTKTIWQVKYWFTGKRAANCLTGFREFEALIKPSDGQLRVRNKPAQTGTDPCIVPPGAGYTGLENQLYRIEIHDGGAGLDIVTDGELATRVPNTSDQIEVAGTWEKGQTIEIFSTDDSPGTLAHIVKVDTSKAKRTLTLDIDVTGIPLDAMFVRLATATYKWSRDNGIVVTTIQSVDGQEVTVHSLGRDDTLGFKEGQWVEISDDGLELNGQPGQLARITKIDPATRLITLNVAATLPKGVIPGRQPKLRRWDGIGAVKFSTERNDFFLDLENGVQVSFVNGTFKSGDYWTAAARTATADSQSGTVEWPQDNSNQPLPQLPFGIKHHYCRLAMLNWDGKAFEVEDCRNLFPPITELTSLFYVSGEGQEVKPDLTHPELFVPLPQPLIVGVANGKVPVPNAEVRFKTEATRGTGRILPAGSSGTFHQVDSTTLDVLTDEHGLARCIWQLDSVTDSQQLRASLQAVSDLTDEADHPVHLPIIFTANLSVARQVAYDPHDCQPFLDDKDVQAALDRMSHLISLYEISGNNQEFVPGEVLQPLVVLAANDCGPVTDKKLKVHFKVVSGAGKVEGQSEIDVIADANGLATCKWVPDPTTPYQAVEATLVADRDHSVAGPTTVRFTSTPSRASHVFYDPSKCPGLQQEKVATVQDAIDHLCEVHRGENCDVTVGRGGQFERLDQAIKQLLLEGRRDVCICLIPGDHSLAGLTIEDQEHKLNVKIAGCGRGSRLIFTDTRGGGASFKLAGLASFTLRDLEVFGLNLQINIDQCRHVTFAGCYLNQENQAAPFITIAHAERIRFVGNVITATLPVSKVHMIPVNAFEFHPDIAALYGIADTLDFNRQSALVAVQLTRESEANRKTMAGNLVGFGRPTLSSRELISYIKFREAFTQPTPAASALQEGLAEIRMATLASQPGTAIVLMDAEADTRIEDNQITGGICLYGLPGPLRLSDQEAQTLAQFGVGKIKFSESLATLQIRNNFISRIVVAEKTLTLAKTLPIEFKQLYYRCFISDNEFAISDNNLVMERLALTSNSFDGQARVGIAIVNTATYIGNNAGDPNRIFVSVAQVSERAANLAFNIKGV